MIGIPGKVRCFKCGMTVSIEENWIENKKK